LAAAGLRALILLILITGLTTGLAADPAASGDQLDATAPAGAPPVQASGKDPADLQREQAIAEFSARMRAANYPALFEQAASEFNVPADVLKGVAFAETRWEQLQWPPGETASPETGMPRPYGIMSLWDNDYFGHSLSEAARLIGQDPEALKRDPLQNMRGAAALLRQLYEQTPKPADAPGGEIESWRKAIVRYCGIPEPELSEAHALNVYEFMNRGYHDYGIEWPEHPVKLEPMRQEVAQIKAAARARLEAKMKAEEENQPIIPALATKTIKGEAIKETSAGTAPVAVASGVPANQPGWMIWATLLGLAVLAYLTLRPKAVSKRK
jgi:hypothetical protein